MDKKAATKHGKIDWMITLVPLGIVVALCVLFFIVPEQSNALLNQVRFFFGDVLGTYYLVIGLGIFLLSLFIAGSKYGQIVLGEVGEKPKYSFFTWQQTSSSIPFRNGSSMPRILILKGWGTFRSGQASIPCSIGASSRGGSIWCWRWRSASCCMSASGTGKDIRRPAAQSWEGIRMGFAGG